MNDLEKSGCEPLLMYRLHLLNKLVQRRISAHYVDMLGVTLSEARMIASVGASGPLPISELAKHAYFDTSRASRAAEALIIQGLVKREATVEDGRVVLVSLTPQGRALYRKVMPIARSWDGELFNCLGEKEKRALGEALDKVIKSITTRRARARS
ncbi:MarR family winged helix-turn-helix transcriptional regulator [Paraburkholderia strydomiana]|uniref:MarR family winged helix-turn-helix transcriptional regulator n=1 Tax=Paraburkholderia strydomiana TaxID=1245417 RepID=UPI001BE7B061|nr:MarR family winged helix-turn-helix transcriptional regulator [Paraburkholderia strydomiana]MBT2792945.1 winged helix-turn-helix transcriptional regulator [Paraburkholderia strydomiana]